MASSISLRLTAIGASLIIMLISAFPEKAETQAIMSEMSTIDSFYSQLHPGWNMGNSLDSYVYGFNSSNLADYVTLWNNPPASSELFAELRNSGFRSVRIPITWAAHIDSDNTIDPMWLSYVKSTVDAALDNGLYVIINAHHDEWYSPHPHNIDYARNVIANVWGQIARYFKDYDNHLLFESMNEPRLIDQKHEWTGTPESRKNVNLLNREFIVAVRSSGGSNSGRYLLIPTYCAGMSEDIIGDFEMPSDSRVGVSLHVYEPYAYSHWDDQSGNNAHWSSDNPEDVKGLLNMMNRIQASFILNDIPVVITEFGAVDKNNLNSRIAWASYVKDLALKQGIPCLWWDNGHASDISPSGTYALLNRHTNQWFYPEIVEVLTGKA